MQNLLPVPGHKGRFRYHDLPEGEVVEVELFYTRGGSPRTRGIYLAVRPVTVAGDVATYILLAGHQVKVRGLERASAPLLSRIALAADAHVAPLAAAFRQNREGGRKALEELALSLAAA